MADSDSDEGGGFCKHCHKNCDTLGTFLRHVSHSKTCKSTYDQDYIAKLRQKSKVLSKRKYYRKLSKEEKTERYKQERPRRLEKAKKSYVPNSTKHTYEGRSFEKLVKKTFTEVMNKTELDLKDLAPKIDFLELNVYEKAIDKVFNEDVFKIFSKYEESENFELSDLTFESLQHSLEKALEERTTESKKQEYEGWTNFIMNQTFNGLYFSTLNKAFLQNYNETFKNICEHARDASKNDATAAQDIVEDCCEGNGIKNNISN